MVNLVKKCVKVVKNVETLSYNNYLRFNGIFKK